MLYIYNIFHEYLIRYSWEMFKVFIKKFQLYIVWSTGTLEKYWKQGCSFFVDFRSSGVKSIPLIEWIRKIDMPGKAKCIYYMWHKIISYGARGWVFLIEHSNSNEDAEKFNLKDSNYTLGVSKANSKSYGIQPFFLKAVKSSTDVQPETVKTILLKLFGKRIAIQCCCFFIVNKF